MKKLKFLTWTLCLLTIPFFTACDDDDEVYEIDMATVHESEGTLSLESDYYGDISIINSDILTHYKVNKEGQRILAYFQFNDDKSRSDRSVKVYDLYKVLTKRLYEMPAEKEDSIGNDRISVSRIYASKNHLNIFFTFLGSNSNIAHMLNLVTTEESQIDENGILEVEFRHNLEGDNEVYPQSGWVSFELNSIPGYTEGTTKSIKVKVNNGDGEEKTYKIEWQSAGEDKSSKLSFSSFSNTKTK